MSCSQIILVVWLTELLVALYPATSFAIPTREEMIVRDVVDGDTLRVRYHGASRLLRLIGIDAPENAPNEKAKKQVRRSGIDIHRILFLGRRAHLAVKDLVHRNSVVTVEFDAARFDKFGRVLAYVFLPDNTMLNEEIVRLGYARLLTWPPNTRYVNRLKQAAKDAGTAKRRFW